MTVPALAIRHLSKHFGSFVANEDISLEVFPGEIHAVVGENGAGKSTLMKCLYGLHRPSSGSLAVRGTDVTVDSPRTANRLGIGMVHQHFMLVPSFPVYRNVVLGAEPGTWGRFDEAGALRRVEELTATFHLAVDPRATTATLPVGLQQRVEILKLLHRGADILIFDEPTAVLSPQEIEGFFAILENFRRSGKTILFIAHKLREVLAVADRISVLRQGRLEGTVRRAEVDETTLARMMVGRDLPVPSAGTDSAPGKELLRVERLWSLGPRGEWALRDVSLTVASGEVLGVAGVMGNGQSELEECLCGLRRPREGAVLLQGQEVTEADMAARRQGGMAYVPEDRLRTGVAPLARLWENLLLGHQREPRFLRRGFLRAAAIRPWVRKTLDRFSVKAESDMIQGGTLSGGNMQKLVLAREMAFDAPFLLISQPTRGVDVGGIAFIHEQILHHRNQGGGILLISSDLDEILALADRVAVMYQGRIVALLPREHASRELVGRYMLSGAA